MDNPKQTLCKALLERDGRSCWMAYLGISNRLDPAWKNWEAMLADPLDPIELAAFSADPIAQKYVDDRSFFDPDKLDALALDLLIEGCIQKNGKSCYRAATLLHNQNALLQTAFLQRGINPDPEKQTELYVESGFQGEGIPAFVISTVIRHASDTKRPDILEELEKRGYKTLDLLADQLTFLSSTDGHPAACYRMHDLIDYPASYKNNYYFELMETARLLTEGTVKEGKREAIIHQLDESKSHYFWLLQAMRDSWHRNDVQKFLDRHPDIEREVHKIREKPRAICTAKREMINLINPPAA